jgi:hypothetical protein
MKRRSQVIEDCIIMHGPNCPTHCYNHLHEEWHPKLQLEAFQKDLKFQGIGHQNVQVVLATDSKRTMKEEKKEVLFRPKLQKTQL